MKRLSHVALIIVFCAAAAITAVSTTVQTPQVLAQAPAPTPPPAATPSKRTALDTTQ